MKDDQIVGRSIAETPVQFTNFLQQSRIRIVDQSNVTAETRDQKRDDILRVLKSRRLEGDLRNPRIDTELPAEID